MRLPILFTLALCTTLPAQRRQPQDSAKVFAFLASSYDKDKDGRITRAEYPRTDAAFKNLDRDGDGVLTAADFTAARIAEQRAAPRRSLLRDRPRHVPKVGDTAPDFELPMLGMKDQQVKLSDFAGKQPVVLIFGSYT